MLRRTDITDTDDHLEGWETAGQRVEQPGEGESLGRRLSDRNEHEEMGLCECLEAVENMTSWLEASAKRVPGLATKLTENVCPRIDLFAEGGFRDEEERGGDAEDMMTKDDMEEELEQTFCGHGQTLCETDVRSSSRRWTR